MSPTLILSNVLSISPEVKNTIMGFSIFYFVLKGHIIYTRIVIIDTFRRYKIFKKNNGSLILWFSFLYSWKLAVMSCCTWFLFVGENWFYSNVYYLCYLFVCPLVCNLQKYFDFSLIDVVILVINAHYLESSFCPTSCFSRCLLFLTLALKNRLMPRVNIF